MAVAAAFNPYIAGNRRFMSPGGVQGAPVPASSSTPVAAPTTMPEALVDSGKPRPVVTIGPESDALAKALLAQASQGQVSTPFEALGKLAQLGVGSWAEDKFQKAEKERAAAPARAFSEALAGLPSGDQNAYRTELGRTLMRIGGQYGNADWVMKGAELLAPPGKSDYLKASPGDTFLDPNTMKPVYSAPAADGSKPVVVDGHLVDPSTGKVIYEAPKAPGFHPLSPGQIATDDAGNPIAGVPAAKPEPPTDVQNYNFYADQEKAAGRQPLSIFDWKRELNKSGAPVTNLGPTGIDYGDPEAGLAWARNPDGTVKLDDRGAPIAVPYQGGSVATKAADAKAAADAAAATKGTAADIIVQDVDRVVSLIESSPLTTTGFIGDYLKGVPGTAAADASKLIDTLEAGVSFDKLQAMRDASKTGGALGNVTPRELELLAASVGNLKLSQSKDQLVFNLKRVQSLYRDAAEGRVIGASLAQGGAKSSGAPAANDPLGIR